MTGRALAGLIAVAAAGAVAVQFWLVATGPAFRGDWAGALWRQLAFFTILTNLAVAITMGAIAARLWAPPARFLGGLMLAILTVAGIYHLLLARVWNPQGMAWWTDQALHTAVPAMVLVWWLASAPKSPLGLRAPFLWMIYPLAYAAYALIRGHLTGFYPYPFLDVPRLGWPATLEGLAILALGFLAAGYAVLGLARLVR